MDSSGQELISFPEDLSFNYQSTNPFAFPEFAIESIDQLTEGYYLFDITPFVVIIDHFGKPVFFRLIPDGCRNFERQPDGSYSYYTNSEKGFLVVNEYFQTTDSFLMVGDYPIDFHEFSILENGNYIVLGYDRRVVDMSQYVEGGQAYATVTGMVFQELDPGKNLLFEWNSWDHISFMDSDPALVDLSEQVIDYIHPNSIVPDIDGNFLLTSRNLSEVTKIDRVTGEIIWRMGGMKNEFEFVNDTTGFAALHSAIRLPNGNIALLDNGYSNEPNFSRGVEYEVDEVEKTTSLVREYRASPDIFSAVMGNVTSLPENHFLVGWGMHKMDVLFGEFDEEGEWVASLSIPQVSFFNAYKVSYLNRVDFFIAPVENTLDFGEVEVGDSAEMNAELSNQGMDPVTLFAFFDESGQFEIVDSLPLEIKGATTEQVRLKFIPTEPGNYDTPAYFRFRLDSTIVDDHMIACRLMMKGSSIVTSSEEANKTDKEFHVFPNPFQDRIVIDKSRNVSAVIIWSVTGEKVFQVLNENRDRIVLEQGQLYPGIYFVEVIGKDGTREIVKVVKGL